MKYAWDILISLDQLVNVILGPILNMVLKPSYKFGGTDDTLSEVFGRNRDECRACYWICRALHLIDPSHCERSID